MVTFVVSEDPKQSDKRTEERRKIDDFISKNNLSGNKRYEAHYKVLKLYEAINSGIEQFPKLTTDSEKLEVVKFLVECWKRFIDHVVCVDTTKTQVIYDMMVNESKNGFIKHSISIANGLVGKMQPVMIYSTYLFLLKDGLIYTSNHPKGSSLYKETFKSFYYGNYGDLAYSLAIRFLDNEIANDKMTNIDPIIRIGGIPRNKTFSLYVAFSEAYNAYYRWAEPFKLKDENTYDTRLILDSSNHAVKLILEHVASTFKRGLTETKIHQEHIPMFSGLSMNHQDLQIMYMLVVYDTLSKYKNQNETAEEYFTNIEKIQTPIGASIKEIKAVHKFKELCVSKDPNDISLGTNVPVSKVKTILSINI